MSGESALHVGLVERLVATVESRHRTKRGIIVFADHHKFGVNQPPTIGGYKPDVFAQDVPETFRVVGEAKTPTDFNDDRSIRQIAAFLDHLALYPNSAFYLAVPWYLKGRANYVMHELSRAPHRSISITVLPFT
jgi:hypothetical protein